MAQYVMPFFHGETKNNPHPIRAGWTRRGTVAAAIAAVICVSSVRRVQAGGKKRFTVAIKRGHVAKDQRTLRVAEGDTVEITFTSDKAIELHLHGIDVGTHVSTDKPAKMTFTAKPAGRFPIEAHGAEKHGGLLYVEVHPK